LAAAIQTPSFLDFSDSFRYDNLYRKQGLWQHYYFIRGIVSFVRTVVITIPYKIAQQLREATFREITRSNIESEQHTVFTHDFYQIRDGTYDLPLPLPLPLSCSSMCGVLFRRVFRRLSRLCRSSSHVIGKIPNPFLDEAREHAPARPRPES